MGLEARFPPRLAGSCLPVEASPETAFPHGQSGAPLVTWPLIVARCGDQQAAPESTLPSFESAIFKGADCIEFDVIGTRDGQLVVHHDYYLGRTNDGTGFVGDTTLAELRLLDAGSWFGPTFGGERIPTLGEVLDLGRGRIAFEIDMRTPTLDFLELLVSEIERRSLEENVELTSSHVPILPHVKRLNPRLRTGVFFRAHPEWMRRALVLQHIIGWMTLANAQVAHLPYVMLDEEALREIHCRGFLAHGSNLNDAEEIRQAILLGIDQLSTDQLDLALRTREAASCGSVPHANSLEQP
jgi:glycerophosphoryl diester phosphodiesterase